MELQHTKQIRDFCNVNVIRDGNNNNLVRRRASPNSRGKSREFEGGVGWFLFAVARARALVTLLVFLFRERPARGGNSAGGLASRSAARWCGTVGWLLLLLPRFSFLVFSIRDKSPTPAEGLRKE